MSLHHETGQPLPEDLPADDDQDGEDGGARFLRLRRIGDTGWPAEGAVSPVE